MHTKQIHNSIKCLTAVLLLLALAVSILLSISFGNADISVGDAYRVLVCQFFHPESLAEFSSGAIHDVVWLIRFPRSLLAASIGLGLSVCGVVMQAVVKNPLADPYVLGVSSGAYLGAASAVILGIGSSFLGGSAMGIMAFAGAFLASCAVLCISRIGGRSNAGKLILAGMAISAVCSAFANFLIYIAQDKEATSQISYWSMGSLGSADWKNVPWILPVMFFCALVFWTQYRKLNLMLLGDDTAITLGTDLRRTRLAYMLLSAFMVGIAVNAAGMIGFVGLIIPHAMRMLFGTDHKWLIPLSALAGAIFLVWADVASRVILKNAELPIGILVALIGAPCFIYLMITKSYGFGGIRT